MATSPALVRVQLGRALPRLTATAVAALTACSLLAAPAGASLQGSGPARASITSAFTAVSCPAARACWAVGSVNNGAQAEIYHWDGSTWTQYPLKLPAQGSSTSLDSVSCAGVSLCWAVGLKTVGGVNEAYALRWNGTRWSAGGANLLAYPTAVFCATATDCWVAGAAAIEHWNGSKWAQVTTPAALASPELPALYCVKSSDCWLTGAKPGLTGTVTGHWHDQAWRSRWTPLKHRYNSYLSGVSCMGAKACLAVSPNINADPTDAMSWNGSTWTRIASPALYLELGAVSCVTGLGCMAVGYGNDYVATTALWTGSQWVSPGNTSTVGQSELAGVSCPTASDCWAVGNEDNATHTAMVNLIEHWNGSNWSVHN